MYPQGITIWQDYSYFIDFMGSDIATFKDWRLTMIIVIKKRISIGMVPVLESTLQTHPSIPPPYPYILLSKQVISFLGGNGIRHFNYLPSAAMV